NNLRLDCAQILAALFDVSVSKTATPTVPAGSDLTYTIQVNHSGPSEVTTTEITDTLDSGTDGYGGPSTTFKSVDAPGWDCATPDVGSSGTITCTIGSIGAGITDTITITVHVSHFDFL